MTGAVPRPAGPFVPAGQCPHLRHDAARRRAGARRGPDGRREARGRPSARAAQGRRHRGRLSGRLAGRLRGGPPDRAGDTAGHRGRRARTVPRRRPAARHRSDQGRPQAASPRVHRDERHPPQAQAPHRSARRRSPKPSAGSATAASSSAATPRSSSRAEDASRTDTDFLLQIYEAVVEAGASTVNIPDTVGYAIPSEFADAHRARRRSCRRAGDGQHPLP